MSHQSKSVSELQRASAAAQQQIAQNTANSFGGMNQATAVADNVSMTTAEGQVHSAQIGAASGSSSSRDDQLAAQSQPSYLAQYSAVRASTPSLLPSQEHLAHDPTLNGHKK